MSDQPISAAIVIARRPALEGPLRALITMLEDVGVPVTTADKPEDAAARLLLGDREVPCVFVDVGDVGRNDAPLSEVDLRLRALRELVPWSAPVLVGRSLTVPVVLAGLRGGAVDVLDLDADNAGALWKLLERVSKVLRDRNGQRRSVTALRGMIEDFLRDLVKTERRSIDLEHKLARSARDASRAGPVGVVAELDDDRPPTVFLVEDDRDVADALVDEMEGAGLTTFAFLNGEEAVAQGERMTARGEAIDLLLCDLRLPGIDGLETVRRLRAQKPGLAAFLMTGYTDVEAATSAADLGVVGFVLKPFDDLHALVQRILEQAQQAMARTREHHYLQRIKERHDHVLQRYRKLAADLDRSV
jgi:FixJ family two-component response regulator